MLSLKKWGFVLSAVCASMACGNAIADDSSADVPCNCPDPWVKYYKDLWDTWWNNPTCSNGGVLLRFIQEPTTYVYFKKIADNYPYPDKPVVDFDTAFTYSQEYLFFWITDGCDPGYTTGPSEFLNNIYKWVNYTQ